MIGSTVAWPLAAHAQGPARGRQKVPTIGFLGGGTAASVWSSWAAAFVSRLAELGWIEHRTIAIEYRWAEGRSDRFAEIAAEFVRLKVDVIVTGGIAVPALMQATSVIPIVIALGSDPVGSGQVSPVWRGQAATSPAYRFNTPSLRASDLNSYARSCLGFGT